MQNSDEESRNAHAGFIYMEKGAVGEEDKNFPRFFVAVSPAVAGSLYNVARVSYF